MRCVLSRPATSLQRKSHGQSIPSYTCDRGPRLIRSTRIVNLLYHSPAGKKKVVCSLTKGQEKLDFLWRISDVKNLLISAARSGAT